MILGSFNPEEFLKDYWQKKPCLIRQALPKFSSFISRDELFQLAMDENVESRIVIERDGDDPWQVIHGPMESEQFKKMPASHWTLLVQGVDLHHQAAAELLTSVVFIPNWRIDDLMISYAPIHGCVGPHLDSYDVFLLQAMGQRRWMINSDLYGTDDLIPDLDLQIIKDFKAEQEWVLEPGDVLYLPPETAHYGIALNECMTFSIGIRAPSENELLSRFVDDRFDNATDVRYTDPDLKLQTHPGEITKQAQQRIQEMMRAPLENTEKLIEWFGCFITSLPETYLLEAEKNAWDVKQVLSSFKQHGGLYKNPACRMTFVRNNLGFQLHVNGQAYQLPASCEAFVYGFSETSCLDYSVLGDDPCQELIDTLCHFYNLGLLRDERF